VTFWGGEILSRPGQTAATTETTCSRAEDFVHHAIRRFTHTILWPSKQSSGSCRSTHTILLPSKLSSVFLCPKLPGITSNLSDKLVNLGSGQESCSSQRPYYPNASTQVQPIALGCCESQETRIQRPSTSPPDIVPSTPKTLRSHGLPPPSWYNTTLEAVDFAEAIPITNSMDTWYEVR
jgi:hypothetical protein